MLKKNGRERRKRAAGHTTEYFDKRIGLEDGSGMPMALAERVY